MLNIINHKTDFENEKENPKRFHLTSLQNFFCNNLNDGFSCIKYRLDFTLDIDKVNTCINKIINRHVYLQTSFENGQLVINKNTFEINYRNQIEEEDIAYLLKKGRNLRNNFLFDILISHQDDHDEISLLISLCINDGVSQLIFFKEFYILYFNQESLLSEVNLSIDEINKEIDKNSYLSVSPNMHKINAYNNILQSHNIFCEGDERKIIVENLSAENWKLLNDICQRRNLTVSSLLIYLYGEIIQEWLKIDSFLLFFVSSNRHLYSKKAQQNIGNFLNYKSIVFGSQNLNEFHKDFLRETLSQGNSFFDIINLESETKEDQSIIPILFSSNINFNRTTISSKEKNELPYTFKKNVLFDCQIFDYGNQLQIVFDFNQSVYPAKKMAMLQKKYIKKTIEFITKNK